MDPKIAPATITVKTTYADVNGESHDSMQDAAKSNLELCFKGLNSAKEGANVEKAIIERLKANWDLISQNGQVLWR